MPSGNGSCDIRNHATVPSISRDIRKRSLPSVLLSRSGEPLKISGLWRLTPYSAYGMFRHMEAVLAYYDKQVLPDGAIVEMKIWRVSKSVPGSSHRLKYSLFYGVPGERIVGYDNERGKGDHRHFRGKQKRYKFATVEQLIADFLEDVRQLRGES